MKQAIQAPLEKYSIYIIFVKSISSQSQHFIEEQPVPCTTMVVMDDQHQALSPLDSQRYFPLVS